MAFVIRRGQVLRVVDPLGRQVCDLYSVSAADPREHLSSGRSIDYADTLYLTTGHVLYSNRERAMWTIGRDDVGRHDLVLTPCSPEMFRRLRGDDGTHPSCYENLRVPLAAHGVAADSIGSTFNIFMDVRFDPGTGKMTIAPPASAAGDMIELRSELDMIVGLTACSSEVTNAGSLPPHNLTMRLRIGDQSVRVLALEQRDVYADVIEGVPNAHISAGIPVETRPRGRAARLSTVIAP